MTQYMTIKEAVDTLDVTQARVYSLIAESKLRKKPDCRPIQVRATDVRAYAKTRDKRKREGGKRGGAKSWRTTTPPPPARPWRRREPERSVVPEGFTHLDMNFKHDDPQSVAKAVADAVSILGIAYEIHCEGWIMVGA